jgi:hypothetical protein
LAASRCRFPGGDDATGRRGRTTICSARARSAVKILIDAN